MFNRLVTAFHVICIHTHTYTHTNARTHERTVFHSLKQTHLQIGSRECLIAYDTFATSATEISYIGKHTLAILICQTCRLRTQGWPICKNLIEKSCLSKYSTLYFCIWFFLFRRYVPDSHESTHSDARTIPHSKKYELFDDLNQLNVMHDNLQHTEINQKRVVIMRLTIPQMLSTLLSPQFIVSEE